MQSRVLDLRDRSTRWGVGCALLFVAVMVAAAVFTGEGELIFPEAAALTVGAWIAPRQPWHVDRWRLVAVMTLSAVGGVLLVRYLPGGLPAQAAVGLVYTGLLLAVSGVTLIPLISACILPIYLGTQSWVYPLIVLGQAVALVAVQWALERAGLRAPHQPEPQPAFPVRARHWAKTVLALELLCLPATLLGQPYLAAPPLLVTFAELFFPHSPLRQRPLRVWLLLAAGIAAGTLLRCANIFWGLPLWLAAVLAFAALLTVCRWLDQLLPPAAAAAILPMLLPAETLWKYPPLALLGAAVIVAVPCIVYRRHDAAHRAAL